jgi:hypothetical protein
MYVIHVYQEKRNLEGHLSILTDTNVNETWQNVNVAVRNVLVNFLISKKVANIF